MTSASSELHQPETALDILRLPLLGRVLRWRWGRLAFQLLLLAVAGLIVYDGLTGPQLASTNSATILAWVHYRGLVLLALLLLGNLFCFACPFTLPRTLARKLSIAGWRWPAPLRNKWLSIAGLFLIFFLYEWLDLWASPWLTAWVAVAYFIGSFALEAIFSESAFCKYVCPLGAFNFVYSMASPFQITARDRQVCHECEGKECVNGSTEVAGCGTELFVPQITSNLNCTFCLDCARACPYDNVALSSRKPWQEMLQPLRARWDLAFLIIALSFMGFFNAFGMVPPVYELQQWLSDTLGFQGQEAALLLILLVGMIGLPAVVLFGGGYISRTLTPADKRKRSRDYAARFAPAFVPMGIGIWLAHYGFHFVIGALTIIPVLQNFLLDHGLAWLGQQPRWDVGYLIPTEWIFPLQVAAVALGFGLSLT
ncbi:MAG: 4Fe-4S binding protein, partial [Anaerolineales bacterium]